MFTPLFMNSAIMAQAALIMFLIIIFFINQSRGGF